MNTLSLATHSRKSRQMLLSWMVAAGLALLLTVGQPVLGQLVGADWTPTASACQTQGSTGDC